MAHETAKLLSLNTFVNLVAFKLISDQPPAWSLPPDQMPSKRERLKAYAGAYRSAMANPATASDFPALNTRAAWLQSFEAWEKIVMVARAIERSDAEGTTVTEDETPEEVPFRVLQGDEPVPTGAGVDPAAFAGGASGGAGGGADWQTQQKAYTGSPETPVAPLGAGDIAAGMVDLSANPPAETETAQDTYLRWQGQAETPDRSASMDGLTEALNDGTPPIVEAVEPAPLESTTVDPVAEPITEPATFETPSDQSDQ